MANYVSTLTHMTDDQMQNNKLCAFLKHTKKRMQMELHDNTHTLSI